MCCSFWEKCKNSPKTGLGCSTPLSVPFRLIGIHFDHCKNNMQIFNFCLFHRLYRGSEVTVGSEDPLHFFKGHFCSRGVKWNTFWPWPIWNQNLPYLCPALMYTVFSPHSQSLHTTSSQTLPMSPPHILHIIKKQLTKYGNLHQIRQINILLAQYVTCQFTSPEIIHNYDGNKHRIAIKKHIWRNLENFLM